MSLCSASDWGVSLFVVMGGRVIVSLGIFFATGTSMLVPPILLMASSKTGLSCEGFGIQMNSEFGPWIVGVLSEIIGVFDSPGTPPSLSLRSALPSGWNSALDRKSVV